MERQEFGYARSYFYVRALGLLALCTFVVFFLAVQTVTPAEWLAVIGAILVAYIVIVGLSPLLTKHVLLRSRLILRQGWYFRTIIPLDATESIGPWDGDPKRGLRISSARHILYVVGSGENLVSIRLREARRFPQVLFLRAKEIVFDVDDRDAFLTAIEGRLSAGPATRAHKVHIPPPEKRRSLPPIQPERADADFRR